MKNNRRSESCGTAAECAAGKGAAENKTMEYMKISETEEHLLERLHSPDDLKELSPEQCTALCAEIRSLLIETVSKTGGHLASNLGSVELTVAMHRVFDSPEDKFVWDVGHQCYTHKILTGRLERFSTLRQENGISRSQTNQNTTASSAGTAALRSPWHAALQRACVCTGTRSILPLPL